MVRLMGGMKKSSTLSKRWPTGWVWMVWWDALPLAWLITWCMEESHTEHERSCTGTYTSKRQNSPCLWGTQYILPVINQSYVLCGTWLCQLWDMEPHWDPLLCWFNFTSLGNAPKMSTKIIKTHAQQGRLVYLNNQMREVVRQNVPVLLLKRHQVVISTQWWIWSDLTYLEGWKVFLKISPAQDPHLVVRLVIVQLHWNPVGAHSLLRTTEQQFPSAYQNQIM